MSFHELLVIGLVGLLGPLLAVPSSWRLPVVLGELVGGVVLGRTGFGVLDAGDPTFTFLADLGFALTMFVAGSHVPVRDQRLRSALRSGLLRAVLVGVVATVLAVALAHVFDTGHAAVLAVVMASSSAALVLPTVDELGLTGDAVLPMLAQVAVADTACIVALPLVIDPSHAGRAALGAVLLVVCGVALFLVLRELERRGWWDRARHESHERHLAVELRISLVVVSAFAALAVATHVSIMLAGFVCGLAIAGVGEPNRLAKQLFAVTDGFLGPVFFVWLGASLALRTVASHPHLIVLGVCLGLGAVLAHVSTRALGQPVPFGAMSAAQLGVPVAAATIGGQSGLLPSGVPSALILGAIVTIAVLATASRRAARPSTA